MTSPTSQSHFSDQACELRAVFDATFAAPLPPPPPETMALLRVYAGGEKIAIMRREMTGLTNAESLARAPGPSPAFLGFAGLHGELYPVWSLATLLGRPTAASPWSSGWLLLTKRSNEGPCAFFCETLEQTDFVTEADLAEAAPSSPLIQAMTQGAEGAIPVISLPALREAVTSRKQIRPHGRHDSL